MEKIDMEHFKDKIYNNPAIIDLLFYTQKIGHNTFYDSCCFCRFDSEKVVLSDKDLYRTDNVDIIDVIKDATDEIDNEMIEHVYDMHYNEAMKIIEEEDFKRKIDIKKQTKLEEY